MRKAGKSELELRIVDSQPPSALGKRKVRLQGWGCKEHDMWNWPENLDVGDHRTFRFEGVHGKQKRPKITPIFTAGAC